MATGDNMGDFGPLQNEPPASNYATIDLDNARPVLDFALNEIAVFSGFLPEHYAGGGLTAEIVYAMSSSTGASKEVQLQAAIERVNDGTDASSDSFATAQASGDVEVPATAQTTDTITITWTDGAQMDSVAAGEAFRLKITRIAVVDGTEASGDLELIGVHLKET